MVLPLMRRRERILIGTAALLLSMSVPAAVRAQMPAMPSMGSIAMPSGSMASGGSQPAPPPDPGISVQASYVSFIDSAVPRNIIGLRFEDALNNRQPSRAEYYHPKTGPGSTGFPFVETRIDYSELTTYAE